MQQTTAKRSERIDSIDVLRGFTLLGIILVHFTEQYYAGMHPQKYADFTGKGILDTLVSGFTGIFVTGKFYMIFSFLFGLSFYLQLSKNNSGSVFFLRFVWRLAILFAIGFIHSTFGIFLFIQEKWRVRLMHLYPVGRMGLTTYLMQTLFGFFIFFGVGFGLSFVA